MQPNPQLWIWSHLLKKSLMENSIFCAVLMKKFGIFKKFGNIIAWKVFIIRVFLVRIFPHSNRIRTRKTPNTDTFHAVHWFEIKLYFPIFHRNIVCYLTIWRIRRIRSSKKPSWFYNFKFMDPDFVNWMFFANGNHHKYFHRCFPKFSGHQGNNCFDFVLTSQ